MSTHTDTSYHKHNLKESYAVLQKSTTATIISKETMATDEEKKSLRQESQIIYVESKLAEDKETKRQEEKKSYH
jgi:hypothetical protein